MKKSQRTTIYESLKGYCTFSLSRPEDYIEITEWTNAEGFDVTIGTGKSVLIFSLTWGQFKLLKKLVKAINKD